MPAKIRAPLAVGLVRERLEARIAAAALRNRLTLVVAPAGSGKTTLLARVAATVPVPVAWYRAESWDDNEARLVRHLEAALVTAVPGLSAGWRGVDEAATALDAWRGGRALLVIDDLHALEGTVAEVALGRLIDFTPSWLTILVGSRVSPDFNLPRLRVSGDLLEIDGDDLRFRAWEVEQLFRDYYQDPVRPAELALLARRTEGWAAGLQFFHLATRGKSPEDRRRILGVAGSSTRLVREYLARNVLAELPEDVRQFLVSTCVLGRLTGELCDRLLCRHGSARLLDDLARRQIFTVPIEEADGSYRYHEVLRAHLDRMLVDELGEGEARNRHAAAGVLLEASGALPEALVAYCRAEDWPAVQRLLGDRGEQVAGGVDLRLEALPPALVRHDPWLALASARRARADGRWAVAIEAYGRAEAGFGTASTGDVCRRERASLAAWSDPVAIPPADWTGTLRRGLLREPIATARALGDADARDLLARGLLLLAAGEVREARQVLTDLAAADGLGSDLAIAALLAGGVAGMLTGDPRAAIEVEDAVESAERAGLGWLARVGRAAARIGHPGWTRDLSTAGRDTDVDPWGEGLAALAEAWAPPTDGGEGSPAAGRNAGPEARIAPAERAARLFRRHGAGVLEAWARGLAAYGLSEVGNPDARDAALASESLARGTGATGPRLLAYGALTRSDVGRSADYERLLTTVQRDTGLSLPPPIDRSDRLVTSVAQAVLEERAATRPGRRTNSSATALSGGVIRGLQIRTFGAFEIELDGRPIHLGAVRPRARAVLRFLAVHAGAAVHREVIQEALWPDVDAPTAARSLHVAISAVRSLLAPSDDPDAPPLIVREGDAYRLAVSPDAVDVGRFELALAAGRAARSRGERCSAEFASAVGIHVVELLPQDGPAEWVVERREQYRRQAVEAAHAVAQEALLGGDLEAAVRACRAGLELDRYYDPLWRSLITARDQAGDAGAAGRDRQEYEGVLAGLGVTTEVSPSSP